MGESAGAAKAQVSGMRDRMRDRVRDRDRVDTRPGSSCLAGTAVSAGIGGTRIADDLPNTVRSRRHGIGPRGPGAWASTASYGAVLARCQYARALNWRLSGNRLRDIRPTGRDMCPAF